MTPLKSKALFFFSGLALGGLVMYILLTTFLSSSTPWTISEGPNLRTSAGPRVALPLPSLPVPFERSAIVDVKNIDWKLLNLDSSEVSFSEFAGKVIFLNFWGTWCEPCVWEMPYLQDLYASLKREDIVFLAVSHEPLEKLRAFATKEALTIPIYHSVSEPPGFEPGAWPTTLVFSKTGNLVLREIGAAAWSHPNVIKFLRNLHK